MLCFRRVFGFILILWGFWGAAYALSTQSTFDLYIKDIYVGEAKHQLQCETDCRIKSHAKPQGLAAMFIQDEFWEESLMLVDGQELRWQAFAFKQTQRGKTQKEYQIHRQGNVAVHSKSQVQVDLMPHTYDTLSLAYAMMWHKIQQHPLPAFNLLDDQHFYQNLRFNAPQNSQLQLHFAQIATEKYVWQDDNKDYKVTIWLAPQWQYVPVQVTIEQKSEGRHVRLSLKNQPKITP